MSEIRRLYILGVCFVSLQAVMWAIHLLLEGWLQGQFGSNPPTALFFTSQLAILIVGSPIFLGHWAWGSYLAERNPAELTDGLRRFYLYVTKAIFMLYLSYGLFLVVSGLVSFWLPMNQLGLSPVGRLLQGLALGTVAGVLWFYHHYLSTDKRLPADSTARSLFELYSFGMSAASLLAASLGAVLTQVWWLRAASARVAEDLTTALGLGMAGLAVWLYHEWGRLRFMPNEPEANSWRATYDLLADTAGALAVGLGLGGTLWWVIQQINGKRSSDGPLLLGVFTTGLVVWLYHEWMYAEHQTPTIKSWRWLQSFALSAGGLAVGMLSLWIGLSVIFDQLGNARLEIDVWLAWVLPGLAVWVYYRLQWHDLSAALGLAESKPDGFGGSGRWLRRVYVYFFSGVGMCLTTLGLIGVQQWLLTPSGGAGLFSGPTALAALLIGLPLWLLHWAWAQQLVTNGLPDDEKSDLRTLYLYAIIYLAVNAAIITSALLGIGILRALFGLPTEGSLGEPISIITAATAVWAYHAFVLRRDIARAGGTALQAGLQRLYWYLVAALGLSATALGLAGVVSGVVSLSAQGTIPAVREQLANAFGALIAGLPVWLLAWWPAQALAQKADAVGQEARQSALRKLYLYGFAFLAVAAMLIYAVRAVFQILNAVLNVFGGENLLSDSAQSLGFAVIATGLWVYHALVLRGDGRWAKQDAAVEAQKTAEQKALAAQALMQQWAGVPIVILDSGDGSFAANLGPTLQKEFPHLAFQAVGLTPRAAAKLGTQGALNAQQLLQAARLIIATWPMGTLHATLAQHPAPKILVALEAPGFHWANLMPLPNQAGTVTVSLRKLLPTLKPAAPLSAEAHSPAPENQVDSQPPASPPPPAG